MRRFAARRAAGLVAQAAIVGVAPASAVRCFNIHDQTMDEISYTQKMRDIQVISGDPRPAQREGEWKCEFHIRERMESVIPKLLRRNGWEDAEIERELSQLYAHRRSDKLSFGSGCGGVWVTVEDFQRTPWYRRYRPNDHATTHYVSIECMKILEENLIPPSQRKDPYSHLRKRQYEDQWFHQKYSEEQAQHIKREQLKKVTKGMDGYGKISRRQFIEFKDEWMRRNKGKWTSEHEIYHAWLTAMGGTTSNESK